MTSEKQIAANQLNAQKSTGPRTEAGKARSAMNGQRHGLTGQSFILTDEDRAAWDAFSGPYIEALKPANPVEQQLAQLLAQDNFRLNRGHAIEQNTFAIGEARFGDRIDAGHPEVHHACTQALVFAEQAKTFTNISLYESRITRNIHKNMKLLLEIQDRRKAEEREQALIARETKLKTRAASATYPENGFAFSNAENSPTRTAQSPETPPPDFKKAA